MKPEGWETYKLVDLVEDVAMGPFGSNLKVDNFINSGVPVIRGSNLNKGGFHKNNFVFVSETKAKSLKRSLAYPDDLVFTHRGTIGQVGIIPNTQYPYYLVSQSQMRLSVNKKYLIPRFLYYFFLSHIGQKELLKNASQVGVPAIANPTKSLKDVNVLVPPISEQSRIVSILSSLDDKIELNLMMNKTLETIAQAIFKEWFEGPKISKLTDYVDLNPKESIKKGAIVKYIEMANLPLEGFSIKSFIHRLFSAGSKFQNYDTLLARITPCLENGKTGFVDFLNPREVGFGSTEFIVMRPKVRVSPYYVYLLSRDQGFRQFAIKSMVGTSGRQRVQTDMLYSFPIAKIELGLMEKFDKLINPFFQKIKSNSDNNTALSQIRDTLLPKLMTGKIRMK